MYSLYSICTKLFPYKLVFTPIWLDYMKLTNKISSKTCVGSDKVMKVFQVGNKHDDFSTRVFLLQEVKNCSRVVSAEHELWGWENALSPLESSPTSKSTKVESITLKPKLLTWSADYWMVFWVQCKPRLLFANH